MRTERLNGCKDVYLRRSIARVLAGSLLAVSLVAGSRSTASGAAGNETELMRELQQLSTAAYERGKAPGAVLAAAVRARQIREQADALSPDTTSELSMRAMAISFQLRLAALGETINKVPGPRTKVVGDPIRMAEVTDAWNAVVNDILADLKRWPEYWHSAPTIGNRTSELFLPHFLILVCQTDQLAGDNWEMPRITDLRQATLPESLASCCLDESACHRIWAMGDCRLGLTIEMAKTVERDALLGYRFAHEYWNAVRTGAATDSMTKVVVATKTIKLLAEMFGAAAGYPRGERHPGMPLPETGIVEWLRIHGSLWPPNGDPFTTVPGLRNPRIGLDGAITCDIIMNRACHEALSKRTIDDFKYYLGKESEVLVE